MEKWEGLETVSGADHPKGCMPSQVAYCEAGLEAPVMPLLSASWRREPEIWGMRGGGLTVGWVVYSYSVVDIKTLDSSLLI